jgi:hypothetical protein
MRALISAWGWRSHYYSTVPFAWRLRVAKHEVRVVGHLSPTPALAANGYMAITLGDNPYIIELFTGRISGKVAPEDKSVTVDGAIACCTEAMVNSLVAFTRIWRPHVVSTRSH